MWRLLPLVGVLLVLPVAQVPAAAASGGFAPRVAVVRAGDVYLFDGSSGAMTRLTTDGANFDPAWDQSGTTLLFARAPATGPQLWRWTATGGLDQSPFVPFVGQVAPDGHAWAYADPEDNPPPNRPSQWKPPAKTWLMERGLRGPVSPVEPGVRWEPLAWSPDSQRLALTRFNTLRTLPLPKNGSGTAYDPETSLWVTIGDPFAGQRRRLQMPRDCCGQPGIPDVAWFSPAGRFLTVGVGPAMSCASCRADGLPFFAVPVDGGPPISLGSALARGAVAWSADDAFVVLAGPLGRFAYTDKHLFLTDTTTGQQRQLTSDPTYADGAPAVSPTGAWIAFARNRDPGSPVGGPLPVIVTRRIWLVRPNGALRPLDPGAEGWADDAPAWTPDGSCVVFGRYQPAGTGRELWAVPVAGGPAQRLVADLGPAATVPASAPQAPGFVPSDYFAVQPNPALQAAARLGGYGTGGGKHQDAGVRLSLLGSGILLLSACLLRRFEQVLRFSE